MLNQLEEDTVRQVVKSFMDNDTLFTALDISNEVKKALPQVRHRDVRDVVRSMFTTDLEPAGWARTDIMVTLEDGNTATALLYYPLSSSWDLDTLYNDQKRNQSSNKIKFSDLRNQPVLPATVSSDGTFAVVPATSTSVTTQPSAPAAAQTAARDMWKNMFQSQPSLFPRR